MSKKLKFYAKSHKYKLGKEELTSVTTFISKFFSKFDAKEVARKLASFYVNKQKKRGVRYWLNEWKEAALHGTAVHQQIESFINGENLENGNDDRTTRKIQQGIEWYKRVSTTWNEPNVHPEFVIYNEQHRLAGTIDLLVEEGNTISLYDWKTNKTIKKKGYDGEMGKEPVSHLDDCNFNKYALQLSLYAYMLELEGKEVKDLKIIHLTEDKAKEIEVPYLKQEVMDMLND